MSKTKVNVTELMKRVRRLTGEFKEIIRVSGYDYGCGEFEVAYDRKNPDEVQLYHELCSMVEKFDDVCSYIEFLDEEIEEVSKLFLNKNGRYETALGTELHCGTGIEFLYCDDYYEDEPPRWVSARIEHDGNDYYIYGYKKVNIGTALIRLRKRY